MLRFTIHGLSTAQPAGVFAQHEAANEAAARCCQTPRQRRMLRNIYRQSAVCQRRTVLNVADCEGDFTRFYDSASNADHRGPSVAQRLEQYVRHAPPLAHAAAEDALHQAGLIANDISHVVTASCTGFSAPGIDVAMIDALGLRRDVTRTMIGFMGCHGAINALRTADGLARQRPGDHVLVCCVELCSLHFQYGWNTQRVVANALFADGAGALVGAVEDTHAPNTSSNGNGRHAPPWRLRATGSYLVPDTHEAMTWSIGDHGFEMTLSPRVPRIVERQLGPWLQDWLAAHQLRISDVGSWAVHPGGPRILDAVERGLALPRSGVNMSRSVLADHGNMSSPTVLFILERLRAAAATRPCVALAFGPGLTIEAALFD